MEDGTRTTRFRFWLWLIRTIGIIVPRRLRADWRDEWQAELEHREALLEDWDRLNWRTKLDLLRRSAGAMKDALWLQTYRWEDEMIQDVRFGLRMLLKNPVFTIVAIVTLALGIGANTAIFSVINSMLLRPLPVQSPEQIVALNNTSGSRVVPGFSFPSFSYPNYKDLRDRNDVFSGLIGYRYAPVSLSHDGINERLWGYAVTGNYFEVLGVGAALGRVISPDDDRTPGAHPVAVVGYKCWQQRFGASQDVLGKEIIVNGRSYAIIGVAPEGFFGTEIISSPDIWFPMAMQAQLEAGNDWLDRRDTENIFVQGRLKAGVTIAQAQANINSIAAELEQEFPTINEGKRVILTTPGLIGGSMRGPVLGFAGMMMAVVGLVLLLACINLANLLLARATDRRKEIAVRLALGASRFRLIRQLLTESVMLAIVGGALGLLPTYWLVNLVTAFKMPANIPVVFNITVDYRVFIFAFALSLLTGVLFGLLPALQATKADLVPALKDEISSSGRSRSWLKSGLVVAQVALSLVLLIGGGLMLRALERAQAVDLGFDPDRAIEASFDLRLQGYTEARGSEFQKQLLERVRALPGVEHAGTADLVPVDLHFPRTDVFIEGRLSERPEDVPRAFFSSVSPGYLQAMRVRLTSGRDFGDFDDENSIPVAIVNESFARTFFTGEDPIGKRFSLRSPNSTKRQIIGVVQDGKYGGLNEEPKPFVYRPLFQSYSGSTSVVVRANGDLRELIAAVRREVARLDPNLPIAASTLEEKLSLPLMPARIAASVVGGFGLLALALAAIGIYGVMSYSVSRRTREIGIRMALGAQKSDVLKLVVRQGLTLTFIGLVLGLWAALAATRLMKSLLFGVSATDPATFVIASLVLATVAFVACYLPARRAMNVDPMVALRYE